MTAPEDGISPRRHLTARKAQGRNIQQLRVVAIFLLGNQYTYQVYYFKSVILLSKHASFCNLSNKLGRKTTAVGGGWYDTSGQVPGKLVFLLKG